MLGEYIYIHILQFKSKKQNDRPNKVEWFTDWCYYLTIHTQLHYYNLYVMCTSQQKG